jgi:predicted nucleic acid-binding Zn ribbon protein
MALKPPRKNLQPARLGDLLQGFFQQKMPKPMGEETAVFGAWAKAVGGDVSRQATPVFFKNGILFVETRHPMWTTELTNKRHLIQRKLNETLSKDLVREIHFRLGKM